MSAFFRLKNVDLGVHMKQSELRKYRTATRQALKGLVVPMLAVPTIMLLAAALIIGAFAGLLGHSGLEYTLGFIGDAAAPAYMVPAQLMLAVYFIVAIEFAFSWDSWTRSHQRNLAEKLLELMTGLWKLWSSVISSIATILYAPRLTERPRGDWQYATFKTTPFLAGERPQLE